MYAVVQCTQVFNLTGSTVYIYIFVCMYVCVCITRMCVLVCAESRNSSKVMLQNERQIAACHGERRCY